MVHPTKSLASVGLAQPRPNDHLFPLWLAVIIIHCYNICVDFTGLYINSIVSHLSNIQSTIFAIIIGDYPTSRGDWPHFEHSKEHFH